MEFIKTVLRDKVPLVNVDCTGTGTYDEEVDEFMKKNVLPYYCNVHSDSFCANYMTKLMETTRSIIKQTCCSPKENDYYVVFSGNGATNASTHLANILKKNNHSFDVLIESVLEHHSNALLWETEFKDTLKERYIIKIDNQGHINLSELNTVLNSIHPDKKVFIALSGCSNVTGVVQRFNQYRKLRPHNFLCVDLAACSPYIDINIANSDIDAVVFSMHKFKGGYSTPGVFILRKNIIDKTSSSTSPFFPGGGTVTYHDSNDTVFVNRLEQREEGGTPNIIGIIKSGYLMSKKNEMLSFITQRNKDIITNVDAFLTKLKHKLKFITPVLTSTNDNRIPIYSFSFKDKNINPSLMVKLLTDLYGIQARGGISCCSLLAEYIQKPSVRIKERICAKQGVPNSYGWLRVSFHYTDTDEKINYVLNSISELITISYYDHRHLYTYRCKTNSWKYNGL